MDGDTTAIPGTADAVWEHVLSLREQVAALARTDLGVLGDADVEGLLVVVEEATRILPVAQRALVLQVASRGIATDRGYKSAVPYLRDLLRVTEADAAARVKAVDRFQARTAVSGQVLPARFPRVADAQAAGVLSPGHAVVIAEALQKLPAAVDDPTRAAAEARLVQTATELDPARLRCAAKHLGAC
ncbi:MAG: DUF222 domain-containing protein, partial [Streptosporangiales bacterium]|nr:DUF222 domain-containing protein [Streptosporangiales bacterium]